jgi:hypothetical protein
VEVGDAAGRDLRHTLQPHLKADLESWAIFMLTHFDENVGFSSKEAEVWANSKYRELCDQLSDAGLDFSTSTWWNEL